MPVSDIRVYAGAADGWVSLRGPEGPAGPSVVSANAGQLAKLGTDNRVLVAKADLDALFVNVAGDTMTGQLTVRSPSGTGSVVNITGDSAAPVALLDCYGTAFPSLAFRRWRGTAAAPAQPSANDPIGVISGSTYNAANATTNVGQITIRAAAAPVVGEAGVKTRIDFTVHSGAASVTPFQVTDTGVSITGSLSGSVVATDANVNRVGLSYTVSGPSKVAAGITVDATGGTTQNVGLQIGNMTGATSPYAILSYTTAPSLFNGPIAIGAFVNPGTRELDVTGESIFRGAVEITGNITSTGTAHNFAANSITASAIAGLPVAATVAPLANAATAAVGVSTAYARQDHVHPLPTLKADDLSDVAITTPSTGQVLRYNGTNFVNAALAYTDITGAPAAASPSTTAGLANTASGTVGTSAAYARADHTHPDPLATARCNFYQASRTLDANDLGKIIVNTNGQPTAGTQTVRFTLPADSPTFPNGTRFEIYDASETNATVIAAPTGGMLAYNASLTAGGAANTAASTPTLTMSGPYSRLVVVKLSALRWLVVN